ncbi:MAG: WD40 repeat domain-containing protein, partial [Pirellulaceae bacterium]
ISDFEKRNEIFLESIADQWMAVSRIGTVKVFSIDQTKSKSPWSVLTTNLGPYPQLERHPNKRGQFWSLNREGDLRLIDAYQDRILAEVNGIHVGGREGLAVLENGDAVTVGNDQFIKVWRCSGSEIREIRRIKAPANLISVAVHEQRNMAAAVDAEARLQVFSFSTGKLLHTHYFAKGSEDQDSKEGFPENDNLAIKTGRVAFSNSGEYIGAYGRYQRFEVIATDTFKRMKLATTSIAGKGGTAICFSPVVEKRMFCSSLTGTGANEVQDDDTHRDVHFDLMYKAVECRDLKATPDSRRLVSLLANDEIHIVESEFLFQIHRMNSPLKESHSIAVDAETSSLLIADFDGQLAFGAVEGSNVSHNRGTLDGVVHWPVGEIEGRYLSPATANVVHDLVDINGNTLSAFLSGSLATKGPNDKCYLLRKRDGIWRTELLRFEGEGEGPNWATYLTVAPSNKLVAVIRQGQEGSYNGRVLIAYEPEDGGIWPSEIVQSSGNMGFAHKVYFGQDGRPHTILHFDYDLQTLVRSTRPTLPVEWPLDRVKYAAGRQLSYYDAPDGNIQFLLTPLHGQGSDAPSLFATQRPESPESMEIEPHWNVPGYLLFETSNGRILAWNHLTNRLYERVKEGDWELLTTIPVRTSARISPRIDSKDRIWFCDCNGQEVICKWYDMNEWNSVNVRLDQPIPQDMTCSCRINGRGNLEILCSRFGKDGKIAVVESVEPIENLMGR